MAESTMYPDALKMALGAFTGGVSSFILLWKLFVPRREFESHVTRSHKRVATIQRLVVDLWQIRRAIAVHEVEHRWMTEAIRAIAHRVGVAGVPEPPRYAPDSASLTEVRPSSEADDEVD